MRFAYLDLNGENEKKVHIDNYKDDMNGKIYCAEGHLVVAKRGNQRVHHFAHKSGTLCSCHDNKGDWHIESQNRAIKEAQEVRFISHINISMDNNISNTNNTSNKNNIGTSKPKLHIADVFIDKSNFTPKMSKFISYDGIVIEYQHSPMTQEVMKKREDFYTGVSTSLKFHLVWVFDCTNWEYHIIRKPIITCNNTLSTNNNNKELMMRKIKGKEFALLGSYGSNVTKILDFGKYDLLVVTKQQGPTITGYTITIDEFDELFLGKCVSSNSDSRHNRSTICS